MARKIRCLNFLSYYSQERRVSEWSEGIAKAKASNTSLSFGRWDAWGSERDGDLPKVTEQMKGRARFWSQASVCPAWDSFSYSTSFFLLSFPNSLYWIQEIGRMVIFSLFKMSKMDNVFFFSPIYQIQSMSYVRAYWDEKWLHKENKDFFESGKLQSEPQKGPSDRDHLSSPSWPEKVGRGCACMCECVC